MCHRNHSATSDATWDRGDERRSALLAGRPGRGEIEICYVCHGYEALGSVFDVERSFLASSTHRIAPAPALFGQTKYCGSCHDAHGGARVTTGVPYPALLRAVGPTGSVVYQGDGVCAGCHPARPASRFDGYDVWKQSAHARLPEPPTGTGIVCQNCHEQHGSSIAPLLRTEVTVTPPAVPATVAVAADDRTQCTGCHELAASTWPGAVGYPASGHGSSASTVALAAEFAPADAERLVGECQSCHAPMGSADASGALIANLLERRGRALCDGCHTVDGPTGAADLASLAYGVAGTPVELVASVVPDVPVTSNGRLDVWVSDVPGVPGLVGPRSYRPTNGSGPIVTANLDADGAAELVTADGSAASLTVFADDPQTGLRVVDTAALSNPATALAAGDVLTAMSGPEIVAADGNSVVVLAWAAGSLNVVRTSAALPAAVIALAVGDLDADGAAEIAALVEGLDQLYILTESAGALSVSPAYATLGEPVSVSIADVHPSAGVEIVVANAGENQHTVSFFSSAGVRILPDLDNTLPSPPAVPTAVTTADVLSAHAGAETVLVWAHVDGEAGFDVIAQQAGTVARVSRVQTGLRFNPRSVATGDVDADGRPEVVLGNAGLFSDKPERTAPSVEIYETDVAGAGFGAPVTKALGGVELAGGVVHVALADIGRVGPSRHPADAVLSHESTEPLGAARHVTCSDCHNTHVSDATTATAPASPGPLKGAWGAQVTADAGGALGASARGAVAREYEVCLTCHATWAGVTGAGAVDSQIATANASYHPVVAAAPATNADTGTLVPGWSAGSLTYCTDCHGNAQAPEADGPHRSTAAPLLAAEYRGISPADAGGLCFDCHQAGVYAGLGIPGVASGFNDLGTELHQSHTIGHGLGCASCHSAHGSTNPYLVRTDIGWNGAIGDGSCTNGCHAGATNSYVRP